MTSELLSQLPTSGSLESSRTEGQHDGLSPEQIASAFLPPTLFDQTEGSGDVDVVFTLFNSPNLFPVSEGRLNNTIVGSPIIGAAVAAQSLVNFPDPVVIRLRLNRLEGRVSRHTFWLTLSVLRISTHSVHLSYRTLLTLHVCHGVLKLMVRIKRIIE